MWDKLSFANGEKGSENGLIICDEEYKGACRITLEKCPKYYAITCGVYGAMVHTAFCGEEESTSKFEEIKKNLRSLSTKKPPKMRNMIFTIISLLNSNFPLLVIAALAAIKESK